MIVPKNTKIKLPGIAKVFKPGDEIKDSILPPEIKKKFSFSTSEIKIDNKSEKKEIRK